MKLHVVNSGSAGNCYVLESNSGAMLIIDAGVRFSEIQKAINFNYQKVVACLLTHEHSDHSKSIQKVIEKGIYAVSHRKCAENIGIHTSPFWLPTEGNPIFCLGEGFYASSFSVTHDVETVGYLINHPECGQIVFATDTAHLNYLFPNTNHFIIEANYCKYVLADRKMKGIGNAYVSDRVERSHCSIQQAIRMLEMNDTTNTQTITLIHLSDANSDEGSFRDQVIAKTGKPCYIAKANTTIHLTDVWQA